MKYILAFTLLTTVTAHAGWWADFCERNLVAEDPWQYAHLTVDQLADTCIRHRLYNFHSKALRREVAHRLSGPLSYEEREILKVCL